MTMQVNDFKKLVETLDLPEDVKNKVLEAAEDKNAVPYEWKNETHLGAEIENVYGNKYILYAVDDSIDFYGLGVNVDGTLRQSDSTYVARKDDLTFTGRKAIMVDTRVPESVDGIENGDVFTAEVDGEKVIAIRRVGINLRWLTIDCDGSESLEPDHKVKLLHRLVEAK